MDERSFESFLDDFGTVSVSFEASREVYEGDAAAGDDTFSEGSLGRGNGIVDAELFSSISASEAPPTLMTATLPRRAAARFSSSSRA